MRSGHADTTPRGEARQPYGRHEDARAEGRRKAPTDKSKTTRHAAEGTAETKAFGQLVALGFDVAVFTPAPYPRRRLRRPSKELSSCGGLRA